LWIALAVTAVVILAAFNCVLVYVNDYYEANTAAQDALESGGGVTVTYADSDAVVFVPDEIRAGLIFYPGGKVEYTAYAPLMHELASNGILCVLPHMMWNLAVLEVDAADGYQAQYPGVEHWYIGGHSLGGSMAATYVSRHEGEYDGLILCAAYSTADLSGSALRVLSIYGSEDGVLNLQKYDSYRTNLPDGFREEVIDGGCHAFFGSYGAQKGDGEPAITNAEQIHTAVDLMADFIQKNIPKK
jgi:dienelactone hydrolase